MKKSVAKGHEVNSGRDHRKVVPRKDLGAWDVNRRELEPGALLAAATADRVPSLLKLKRERMSLSAFSYFRGAAAVMAYDLSLFPRTHMLSELCGDAHVQNLGAYEGIDGKLIFDINDFDETMRGPFEWDVKRMATSLLLAGHEANIGSIACHLAADQFLSSYCALMKRFAHMPVLGVARYMVRRLNADPIIGGLLAKAERASPLKLRDKLTEVVGGKRVFRSEPPVLRRVTGEEKRQVLASLPRYRASLLPERRHFFDQFTPLDVGFKVVGTGSVGLRDYCVYMEGNGENDPLILQIKQEAASVYAPYLAKSKPAGITEGQRVADGQRAMQLQSDPMLGWTTLGRRGYLVRQLNDHKATLDVTTLSAAGLAAYGRVCGEMLARGHARSGNARLIAGYIGKGQAFSEAILRFATSYADQTKLDYGAMAGVKGSPSKRPGSKSSQSAK